MLNCSTFPSSQVHRKSAIPAQQEHCSHNYGQVPPDFRIETAGTPKPAVQRVSTPLQIDVASRFGRRLREMRVAHGFTQCGMAHKFGTDRSFISDVERGKKSVSLPTLEVIALGFKMNISQLMKDI